MAAGKFHGKVVAVTGAASGIGRTIIAAFAREGATCVIVDTDHEWAESVEAALNAWGTIGTEDDRRPILNSPLIGLEP